MCDVSRAAVCCRKSTEWFAGTVVDFLDLHLQFQWPQWLPVWRSISYPTFAEFLYVFVDFYILISVQSLFYYIPIRWHCYVWL